MHSREQVQSQHVKGIADKKNAVRQRVVFVRVVRENAGCAAHRRQCGSAGILEHGTAIGMGLATGVNRLRESPAASKVVILLTDGENNAGYIQPLQAAEMARALGVRVYTIGIGTEGMVLTPEGINPDGSYFFAMRYTKFDTKLLQEMARLTQGKFFRARTVEDLAGVYDEIDRLEKTKIEYSENYHTDELFIWPAGLAIALLLLEILLRYFALRTITV